MKYDRYLFLWVWNLNYTPNEHCLCICLACEFIFDYVTRIFDLLKHHLQEILTAFCKQVLWIYHHSNWQTTLYAHWLQWECFWYAWVNEPLLFGVCTTVNRNWFEVSVHNKGYRQLPVIILKLNSSPFWGIFIACLPLIMIQFSLSKVGIASVVKHSRHSMQTCFSHCVWFDYPWTCWNPW